MAAFPSPTYSDDPHCDATTASKVYIKPGDTASTMDYMSKDLRNDRKPLDPAMFSRRMFRKMKRAEEKDKRKGKNGIIPN
jgi:hypothetical protein